MRRWGILVLCLILAGCAGHVALLNDEGGGVGKVAVLDPGTGGERGQLTTANTQTSLGGPVAPRPLTKNYDALLAVMPAPAKVFTLYFVEGTTQITPDSAQTLEDLRHAITPTSDVQITGHTDTTGDVETNDKLSLARAIEIRAFLVQAGLRVADARATGRGERELKVRTGPGVSEPLNRRVEVIVR